MTSIAVVSAGLADGLSVVTPVFAASYSGLFEMFFDGLEHGTLDGKPVLVAATAGTRGTRWCSSMRSGPLRLSARSRRPHRRR